jgi:hypothetical protein
MPHTIRLRGPWEFQPLARFRLLPGGGVEQTTDGLPAGGTLHLPADGGGVLGRDFQGIVRFTRRFHRPTGLTAASRVWLVIDDVDWRATVTLNERRLGEMVCSKSPEMASGREVRLCPARFDVTAELLPLNVLSIVMTLPDVQLDGGALRRPGRKGEAASPIGLVSIEIEQLVT